MGAKLLWLGLTIIMCSSLLAFIPVTSIVGQIIMIVGVILLFLDK